MARRWTLSLDLRERAVAAYQAGEGTIKEVAVRFRIGHASLSRLLRQLRERGTLAPSASRGHREAKIDVAGEARLRQLVTASPDATLDEVTAAYNAQAEVHISATTLGRKLRALKLTRKKSR